MKAAQGESGETDRLSELHEDAMAIQRELRNRRAHSPPTKDRVRVLEDRLRTKLLPSVSALCRGDQNQAGYAYAT